MPARAVEVPVPDPTRRAPRRRMAREARRGLQALEERHAARVSGWVRAVGDEIVSALGLVRLDEEGEAGRLPPVQVLERAEGRATLARRFHVEQLAEVASLVDDAATRNAAEVLQLARIGLPSRVRLTNVHVSWARQHAGLITRVEHRLFEEVRDLVVSAHASGLPTAKLAAQVQERLGVAKSRARLIARDQIGKLNGRITEERQTSVGVTSYVWSTSLDERVRPEHAEREGQEYRWDAPPSDGHPGYPIQCRCTAIPVPPG